MRINLPCSQCVEEGFKADRGKTTPFVPTYPYWEYPEIELTQWPYYETVCPNGHKHRITLSLELHELLFQQATYCIEDGYYREAVGTYHAALERFFEYATELLCLKLRKDFDFEPIWKKVRKQSERQLGAYYFIWACAIGECPVFLDDNKKVPFRNQVVHQGRLVTKKEAYEYGEYVFNYIRSETDKLAGFLDKEMPLLKMSRLLRLCKDDFEKAKKDPIRLEKEGELLYEGIGSISMSCFLSSEEIVSYADCFEEHLNPPIGLMK